MLNPKIDEMTLSPNVDDLDHGFFIVSVEVDLR